MSTTTTEPSSVVIHPYPALNAHDFLGGSDYSCVHLIDQSIAFKNPVRYRLAREKGHPDEERERFRIEQRERECLSRSEREKKSYRILDADPHPNLLQSFLVVPEGIFMQRLRSNLEDRLNAENSRSSRSKCCRKTQAQWIRGIARASAWMESKGLVHGDIQPSNVLLDENDNVKLCDFDCTVRIGEPLLAFNARFGKPGEHVASVQTSIFAIGSVIYTIDTRQPPFYDVSDESDVERRFRNGQFPSTDGLFYSKLILNCWRGTFPHGAALAKETEHIYNDAACSITTHYSHSHIDPQFLTAEEIHSSSFTQRCSEYRTVQLEHANARQRRYEQWKKEQEKQGKPPTTTEAPQEQWRQPDRPVGDIVAKVSRIPVRAYRVVRTQVQLARTPILYSLSAAALVVAFTIFKPKIGNITNKFSFT